MCEFISWIEMNNKVLFLTDADIKIWEKAKDRPGMPDKSEIIGHGAIRSYYGLGDNDGIQKECADLSKPSNFPKEMVSAIKRGLLSYGFNYGAAIQVVKKPVWKKADAEREKAHAEWEKAYAERKKAYAEREKAHAEWEKAYAERKKAYAEREKADAEREKADAEWEKAYAEWEKADAERKKADAELSKYVRKHFSKLVKDKRNRTKAWK